MPIPQFIHQMWLSKTGTNSKSPPKPRPYQGSFEFWNPTFVYHFWTMNDMKAFLESPQTSKEIKRFKELFYTIEPWICKCDVARYMILYELGGVYADLDFECLQSLQPLLAERDLIFCRELDTNLPGSSKRISNAFIGAQARHPLFLHILNEINLRKNFTSVWN